MKSGRWAAEQVAHRRGKVTERLSQATLFLSIGTTQRGTKKTVHYSHKLKGCRAQDSTTGSFFFFSIAEKQSGGRVCRASQHMVLSKLAMRRGAGKGRHLVRIEDFAKFLICIPAVILRSRSGKFGSTRANLA